MKFRNIVKREQGKYITRYDVEYLTDKNETKIYEIISRDSNITDFNGLHGKSSDAVVIIVSNETGDKILLNKEFRLAVGEWIYNFPAGLIEEGETPIECAKRELREETGLELYKVEDILGVSYSAVGFSNETNVCIIGKAGGNFSKSSSPAEEIEAKWYTKEEVTELLKNGRFAARTQAYCYMWSRS